MERIGPTLAQVTGGIERSARERGLEAIPAGDRGPYIIGSGLPDTPPDELVGVLAARDVYAGVRSTWLRVAPHLHTTDADIERMVGALDHVT